MARLQLVAALLPLCALAYQAIPDKYANNAELRAVKWMGELANPFESFPEARWEKKESPLPHERMQFFGGDDDHEDPHVEAQFRSVPKYLLDEEDGGLATKEKKRDWGLAAVLRPLVRESVTSLRTTHYAPCSLTFSDLL